MANFALHLPARDLEVLDILARHGQATTGQLTRLLWTDGVADWQGRRARRTLARLANWGLVARTRLPVGGQYGGSRGYLYQPTSAKAKPLSPHMLALTELYVRLVEADRARVLELSDFSPEPECHRTVSGIELKPDATIRISTQGRYRRCFIELDRGTEWAGEIGRKLSAYTSARNLWPEGEVFPAVFFIVQHDLPGREAKRAEDLTGMIQAHPAGQLFNVCRYDQAITALVGTNPPTAIRRPA
jgi:predicted transcriptional regulator